jgi:phosphatidylserine/phosphatidylglycerophosphate/cardiolipin synthase-like enzyme
MPNAAAKPILHIINKAKRDLDINVYYLTDKPILRAIRRAVKRNFKYGCTFKN